MLNSLATVFLIVTSAMILFLPRRFALFPLLAGACLMSLAQGIEIRVFHFTSIRILIAIGIARVIIRREYVAGGVNSLDWLMLVWSIWTLASSAFHKDPTTELVYRLGIIYNTCGVYFLIRIFCQSFEDIKILCVILAFLLMPVAVEMIYEKLQAYNLFSIFGGTSEIPEFRGGKVRSRGPFAHSILAGTVGAGCLPLMIALWPCAWKPALIGVVACIVIVITSASSGPIMSVFVAIAAVLMWRYRQHMKFVRWFVVFCYVSLDIIMKDPAYYIMGRIDLVGGSSGYHRAAIIESAIIHMNEWWLTGTDYTRHWMPTGVSWSADHSDITNQYIHYGIVGGLPLIFIFFGMLYKGFSYVGKIISKPSFVSDNNKYLLWGFGSALFTHAVTFFSVTYFDQSMLFIDLTLAVIGSSSYFALAEEVH